MADFEFDVDDDFSFNGVTDNDGLPNGYGTLTLPDGTEMIGYFTGGQFMYGRVTGWFHDDSEYIVKNGFATLVEKDDDEEEDDDEEDEDEEEDDDEEDDDDEKTIEKKEEKPLTPELLAYLNTPRMKAAYGQAYFDTYEDNYITYTGWFVRREYASRKDEIEGEGYLVSKMGFKYKGYVRKGEPDGYGRMELNALSYRGEGYFEGEFKEGKPHGKGVQFLKSDGVIIEGTFYGFELYNGQYKITFPDGTKMSGERKNYLPIHENEVRIDYPNGDIYEGFVTVYCGTRTGLMCLAQPICSKELDKKIISHTYMLNGNGKYIHKNTGKIEEGRWNMGHLESLNKSYYK